MAKSTLFTPVDNAEHALILQAYGTFLVAWSVFESILDFVIEREAGLKTLHAIIIVSGLGFERKSGIAKSLLALNPKNAEAISTINKLTQEAGRNAIIHGEVHVGKKHIEFVKHKTDQMLKTSVKSFTATELTDLVKRVSALTGELQDQVNIQDDDLIRHGEIAKSLWSKSATSPSPPSSTTHS